MAQQINLYDPSLRPQRPWVTPGRLALAVVLLWAAMAGAAQWLRQDAARWNAVAATNTQQLQALAAQQKMLVAHDDALPALRLQLAQAQQQAQSLRLADDGPPDQGARVLAALAAAGSPDVWITAAQWQASPRQLSLEGGLLRADQLPAYLRRLERQPAFSGQDFSQVQLQPASPNAPPHHRFVLRSQPKESGR